MASATNAPRDNVTRALSRLAAAGDITRAHRGLYAHKGYTGPLLPDRMEPATGFGVIATSGLYKTEEGLLWVKTARDADKAKAAMEETFKAFMEPLKGLAKPVKPPRATDSDTLTEYVIADLHLGMYCWDEEVGDSYDIGIASDDCRAAIDRLVASTPNSEICLINQLGDFFHTDDGNATTLGTVVDSDSRHKKVCRAGVETIKYVVAKCLEKHKTVWIRNTPGNHDNHTSTILDIAIANFYENDPRVEVKDTAKLFWAYSFGKCLVGIGHGDRPPPKDLPKQLVHHYVMTGDYPDAEFYYCRHGHLHSSRSFEDMGIKCEGFRTIAPKDAWSTGKGFVAGREAVAIVLHKTFGEIERHTAGIARIHNDK